jgi:hypothetical protein
MGGWQRNRTQRRVHLAGLPREPLTVLRYAEADSDDLNRRTDHLKKLFEALHVQLNLSASCARGQKRAA